MEWIEDVFYGAVTKGVNVSCFPTHFETGTIAERPFSVTTARTEGDVRLQDTTVAVFKGVCLATIASLAVCTYLCANQYPELLSHCIFALFLSIFLYAIMYWWASFPVCTP